MLQKPIFIYDNWTAYDELADTIELTEALATYQLHQLLRLRTLGARFDYYLMDAFWFAPEGGYRTWRKPHWPDGPDRFLDACLRSGIKPGLWIGGNNLVGLKPLPEWENSLASPVDPTQMNGGSMCMFQGGFLPHLLETLCMWYARGVRLFKFDFMNFNAATPALRRTMLPSEIRRANEAALISGLKELRASCPEVVLTGYNGFEEAETITNTSLPIRKTIGTHWLEAFDSMYCGDPRPADVPGANFWRSMDIYSDHMTRVYEQNGYPLQWIDNCSFMIGVAGSCYARGIQAWKGMLVLSLARGGWVNSYHGNLELLDEESGCWFARAQDLFFPIQHLGRVSTFGGIPSEEQPYGFLGQDSNGCLVTAVNPGQLPARLALPVEGAGRILFTDAGFLPRLEGKEILLGGGQMAVAGFGKYASPAYDLGLEEDVRIPAAIELLSVEFSAESERVITAHLAPPASGRLRLVLHQLDPHGLAKRSSGGGSPPAGIPLDQILRLSASQDEKPVVVEIDYAKAIWSGLSWAVGEIDCTALQPGQEVQVRFESQETAPVRLEGKIYHVIVFG
jgi:hypothetical protein